MRKFNLARTSPSPEAEDPDSAMEGGEVMPPRGGGKARRVLVMVVALLIVAGGGYIALTRFIESPAAKPEPPARPIRPIAKAPSLPMGPPAAGSPAPMQQSPAPTGQALPAGPGAPAKSAETPMAAQPSPLSPIPAQAVAAPPARAGAQGPAAKTGEPVKLARTAPAESGATLAPPAIPPARAESPAAAGSFSIQVGAMINESNAEQLKRRLEQLGYSPIVRRGRMYVRRHLVTTGEFPDRARADEAAKRLAALGIGAGVIASAGRFSVEAGSFTNEDDAIDLARQLQRLDYPPRIHDQTQDATVYQIRLGAFVSRAEAKAKGAELESKGFRYLIVRN